MMRSKARMNLYAPTAPQISGSNKYYNRTEQVLNHGRSIALLMGFQQRTLELGCHRKLCQRVVMTSAQHYTPNGTFNGNMVLHGMHDVVGNAMCVNWKDSDAAV